MPITVMFCTALAATLILTPVAAALARATGFVDRPGGLKRHAVPVPYLGGAAVLAALGLATAVASRMDVALPAQAPGLLAGGLIVFLVGLADDRWDLPIAPRLIAQAAAGALVVGAGVTLEIEVLPPRANEILSVVWVVGLVNALNIIDIMDGLCASVALAASLALAAIAVVTGADGLALACVSLSGASLGFFVHNRRPASIYLGDAGASLIGFMLAVSALAVSYTVTNRIALFVPLLVLAVPVFDTILVIVTRLQRGRSPLRGSADHLALRLRAAGLSVERTVNAIFLASLALGLAALAIVVAGLATALLLYAAVAAGAGAAWLVVTGLPTPETDGVEQ